MTHFRGRASPPAPPQRRREDKVAACASRDCSILSFAYNVARIPLAAGVLYPLFGLLLSPVVAAGAMALSSVSVIAKALRLHTVKVD